MNRRAAAARFCVSLLFATLLVGAPCTGRGEGGIDTTVGEPPAPSPPQDGSHANGAAPPVPEVAKEPAAGEPFTHLRTIPSHEAAGILGKRVIGAAGEDIGMVVDVLIDDVGTPRAAVIDFGGFLGVGNRKIAVDWGLLQFRPGDQYAPILLDVTGESIAAAPEYRSFDSDTGVIVAPPEPPPPPENAPPPVGTPAIDASPPAQAGAPTAAGDSNKAGRKLGEDDAVPNPAQQEESEAPRQPGSPQPRPSLPRPSPPTDTPSTTNSPAETPPSVSPPAEAPPATSPPAETPPSVSPLPEMKPPEGGPSPTGPAGDLPPAEDPGAPSAPSLPATPPNARQ